MFVSYLAGALALLLFASSVLSAIRRRELYPRSMRVVVSVLAFVFVAMLTVCVATFQVQHRSFVQLKTAFAFFAWLTAVAIWRAPVGPRAKLGVTLFALPSVLHTAALFVSEMGWGRGGHGGRRGPGGRAVRVPRGRRRSIAAAPNGCGPPG